MHTIPTPSTPAAAAAAAAPATSMAAAASDQTPTPSRRGSQNTILVVQDETMDNSEQDSTAQATSVQDIHVHQGEEAPEGVASVLVAGAKEEMEQEEEEEDPSSIVDINTLSTIEEQPELG